MIACRVHDLTGWDAAVLDAKRLVARAQKCNGGGGQTNSGQASTAAAQQTAANNQDMAISAQNAALQQRMTNALFGNGSPGSTGSLSGMMNPANLTQSSLNPAYTAQFNQGKNQLAQSTAQQKGSLAQSFANSGATGNSTPSGFQQDQMRQLGSSQADQQGTLYSTLMGKQYTDALNNFWNANNIASGNAATGASTSVGSAGNAGSSSAGIYSTAGQQTPSTLNSIIGAAGTAGSGAAMGATMCPADGSMILMADGSLKKVELIVAGDLVLGMDILADEVIDIQPTLQSVCLVSAAERQTTVSESHTFERHDGGYAFALKSEGEMLSLVGGGQRVVSVIPLMEKKMCRHIMLKRSHGYCSDGFWSLE